MREVLQEKVASGQAPLRVNRQRGIIYGVKVLGERSANPPPRNNVYPRPTRERAAGLIEGARAYIDHPARNAAGDTRSYHDSLGVLRKVRESGNGLARLAFLTGTDAALRQNDPESHCTRSPPLMTLTGRFAGGGIGGC
jgi:hypothetical protein